MYWLTNLASILLMAVILGICTGPVQGAVSLPEKGDRLTVSGVMEDAKGKGIKEVELELLVNGQKVKPLERQEHLETGSKGSVVGRYRLPQAPIASRSGVPVETVSKVILRHPNLFHHPKVSREGQRCGSGEVDRKYIPTAKGSFHVSPLPLRIQGLG